MKKATSFLLILILFFSSCQQVNWLPGAEYAKYIAGFTSGVISCKSSFVIELQDEYMGMERIGDEIKENLFEFSPSIKGKTILKGNNKVEFIPSEPLESDKEYKVFFALNKAMKGVPSKHKELVYKIKTIKPEYKMESHGIESASASSSREFNYKGVVKTSDFVKSDIVEQALSHDYDNNKSKVKWIHNAAGTEHEFEITHIAAEKEEQTIEVSIDGDELGGENNEEKVTVPSSTGFSIISMQISRKDNNRVKICFSKNVKVADLTGMFSIGDKKAYKFEIDKNMVYLYPEEEITGDAEVKVFKGIKSTDEIALAKDFSKHLEFGSMKPRAEIVGKGNIIVGSESVNLPIKTMGLNAVQIEITKLYQNNVMYFLQNNSFDDPYQINRLGKTVYTKTLKLNRNANFDPTQWTYHNLDLKKIIDVDPGTLYKIKIKFDQSMSAQKCTQSSNNLISFLENTESEPNGDEDYYSSYYPRGYNYEEREDPCKPSYYTPDRFPEKVILASNIGMIVKKGTSNKIYTTLVDMQSTQSLSGVTVEVFDAQLQSIGSKTSDGNGFADIDCEGTPFIVIAKKGKERAYQRLSSSEALNVDVFDVAGMESKNGIKGYIYGERGVWRPGDKIFLTLLLDNKGKPLPADIPVQFELANPSGQIYDQKVNNKGQNGFFAFETYTPADAVTGNWIARFKVGNSIYEKTIKIETIKPNRIKMQEIGGSSEELTLDQNLQYEAMWLTGSLAANLKTTVDVNWLKAKPDFPSYSQYTFENPTLSFSGTTATLFDGTTDANGQYNFSVNFEKDEDTKMPAMLRANLVSKVFENSGDFSIQYDAKNVYMYPSFVGFYFKDYSKDDYWYGLQCNKNYTIDIVNVNSKGKLIASNNVVVKLIKTNYDFWYNSYNATEFFTDDNIKEVVSTQKVAMANGIGKASISVPNDKWGKYLILIEDVNSGHTSGMFQYFDVPYESKTHEEKESSTMLPLTMNKQNYSAGEQASVVFNSPFKGRALLSIENSTGVLTRRFVDIAQGKNTVPFDVMADMSPNAYVSISLLQPHSQTKNNLPIRMFGIVPFQVSNIQGTTLQPQITSPQEIKPESVLNVSVSEKNGKAMTYTLAVVDEGLLGVTSFKTPNPWKHFYSKEALGVATWDMFDRVIGVFTGVFESMFSIGGDEEAKNDAKEKVKRFDPVVTYLGPFTLGAGESKAHQIKIPNYMGSVKAMVIAGDGKGAFGTTESFVRVAQPLMLLTTFPRMISPEEEIELPVNLFVTKANIKFVDVKVTCNKNVEIIGKNIQQVPFETVGDKIVSFRVKVKNNIGVAKFQIEAKSGEEKAHYEFQTEIRIPNPPTIKSEEYVVMPGEKKTITVKPYGIYSTRSVSMQVSGFQNLNLQSRIEQLITYPYGCLEQTSSSAFPQLFLDKFQELTPVQKTKIDSNVAAAIERIKGFQTGQGGFSYWPNDRIENPWASIYATHFLWYAQNKGYAINNGMLQNSLENIKKAASQTHNLENDYYHQNIQAYRLYLLALTKQPDMGSMNRLKELNLTVSAKIKLGLAYIHAGKKDVAKTILDPSQMVISPYYDGYSSYSSDLLDHSYLLEAYSLMGDILNVQKEVKFITNQLNSNRFLGTQNTAMALRVMSEYVVINNDRLTSFEAKTGTQTFTGNGTQSLYEYKLGRDSTQVTIENKGKNPIYVNIGYKGINTGIEPALASSNLEYKVVYKDKVGNLVDITQVKKQTELVAHFTIVNKSRNRSIYNLALNYMVPSGWEIINNRIGFEGDIGLKNIDNFDVRDDRIYYFFNLSAGATLNFTQPFVASYEGNYILPTSRCEAMYNPDVYAFVAGKRVKVVK